MELSDLLRQKKTVIVKKWFDSVVGSYPVDTCRFLKNQKDPFSNPVGSVIVKGLEPLFNELLDGDGIKSETVESFLEPMIKIRAVQTMFSPSQATAFIFLLKKVIRENIKNEARENQIMNELLIFESRIDDLSLIAFDVYMKCREKLYQIKVDGRQSKILSAFQKAGLVTEIP